MKENKRIKSMTVLLTEKEHDDMIIATVKYHTTTSKLFRMFLKAAKEKDLMKFLTTPEE